MAEPFMGEIRMFGGNFAPKLWAACDGQMLAIGQNAALYSLLGTTFGGDGKTTIALPNMEGRTPIGVGTTYEYPTFTYDNGTFGGATDVTLSVQTMPIHRHPVYASNTVANFVQNPGDAQLSRSSSGNAYTSGTQLVGTAASSVSQTGGGQGNNAHNNVQPYQALLFCIALQGIYPPRN